MMLAQAASLSISREPWQLPLTQPLVIAHRGASMDMPELASEAYRLAIEQGNGLVCSGILAAAHQLL